MNCVNEMSVRFLAVSENEAFARICVASFCSILNPTIDEIGDIKTAVSEAVTNSIVHGYNGEGGKIIMEAKIEGNRLDIKVIDLGIGIDDIDMALQPFFTSKAEEEHSGMGFTLMDSFMSNLSVEPNNPKGLIVHMQKVIKK